MVHGRASICKVLNTVYEKKSGTLRRIKTEEEKEAEAFSAMPMGYVKHMLWLWSFTFIDMLLTRY